MSTIQTIEDKLFNTSSISSLIEVWKQNNHKIVFTNGCFDLLHLGHIKYLADAADLGDKLVVGLNSDNSVRKIKGEHRPIKDEISRKTILASLSFIDAVVIFEEETPYNLIKTVVPHVLVKGDDYKAEEVVGYDIVKENKGEVLTIKFVKGYSTSDLEQKIKSF